jgi:hypothetical protein
MSSRFDVRGWVLRRIQASAKALRRTSMSDADVHAVRRDIKRARAGLRMLRESIGEAEYRRNNTALRDVAGALRQVRDAKMLQEAGRRWQEPSEDCTVLRRLRSELALDRQRARRRLGTRARVAGAAVLQAVAQRLNAHPPAASLPDDRDLTQGLRRSYRKSRKACRAAHRSGSDTGLHEWRKQVKYFYNQLVMLKELGSRGFSRTRQRAERLSDLLGEDHDLALLAQRVGRLEGGNPVQLAIAHRRGQLQRKSRSVGAKLLAEPPQNIKVK